MKCEKCNKEFEQKRNRRFCSRSCANGHIHDETWKRNISKGVKKLKLKPSNKGKSWDGKSYVYCEKRKCSECRAIIKKNNRTGMCWECRKKLSNKKDQYRTACKFQFNLSDYPSEFDFNLVKKYGKYKPSNKGNNLDGVSRDHMVSVSFGFENKISPKIIAHPANCRLIKHKDNSSKGMHNLITIEELYKRIDEWNIKYQCGGGQMAKTPVV